MQKVILTGFVVQEPEKVTTPTGNNVTNFVLGVFISKSREKVGSWYRINCWGDQFNNVFPYIKYGKYLTVIGELKPPVAYKTQEDKLGIHLNITCESINFLHSNSEKKKEQKESSDEDY